MSRFSVLRYSLTIAGAAILFSASPRTASALDGAIDDTDDNPVYPNACAVIGVPPDEDPDRPLRMASGVLIHPRVVLTAGHVTDWFATIWDVPFERTRISFSADAFDASQWLEVEGYCTHPLYNGYEGAEGFGDTHDLGLVILKEDVVGIEPAALPYAGLLDDMKEAGALEFGAVNGTLLPVVGYGWGYSFPPPTDLRDERGIRRYGPMICMGMMKSSLHFLLDPDGTVTQNGDSGGPTFLEIDDETTVLVAIVAWGSPIPGVDHRYRVDTVDSRDFIDAVLWEVECSE
jgi:hypothetical protein